MRIPLVADKQLPKGDWPMPIVPQEWHYRQSIEYEMTNNRAMLDLASRYRETWLYNIYQMGRNSIEKGNKDTWTITPKRIAALEAAAGAGQAGRGGRGRGAEVAAGGDVLPGGGAAVVAGAAGCRRSCMKKFCMTRSIAIRGGTFCRRIRRISRTRRSS